MKRVQQISDSGPAKGGVDLGRAFWRWWKGELIALFPRRLAMSRPDGAPGPALRLGEHTLEVLDRAGAPTKTLPAGGIRDAAAWLKANRMAGPGLTVLLPLSRCLVRTIKLPGVAPDDVRALLNLDLRHTTPFKINSVLWTFVDDSPAGSRAVTLVRQIVVHRDLVDAPLAGSAEHNLTVKAVHIVDERGRVVGDNLLTEATDQVLAGQRVQRWILAALAVGIGASVWLGFNRQEASMLRLRDQVETARRIYQTRDVGQRKEEALVAAAAELARLGDASTRISEVLREITRLMPDSAWLTDLRIADDKIELSGFASGAAALIDLFSSTPWFSDVAFIAPVTRDDREGKDHFVLSLKVRRPL